MTDKLQKFFDLPEDVEDGTEIIEVEPTTDTMSNLEKIDNALPSIKGLEASDQEMDALAKLAVGSYKDLMTLGMNVEARHASDIISSASQFLGHAITAKQSKINKKLKMIDLLLKKAKLDLANGGKTEEEEGTGHKLDRNELLAEVLKQVNSSKKS